jgi:hypothetical protein
MTAQPVHTLSNRELLEEIAEGLRVIGGVLAELEPLLAIARSMTANGSGPSYVQAAGLRRALKRGRTDAPSAAATPSGTPGPLGRPAPGPGHWHG